MAQLLDGTRIYGTATVDTNLTIGGNLVDGLGNSTTATNAIKGSAKAWVNFDGTPGTPTIRSGYNVSSVTKSATGVYTVNYTTAMPNTNYAAVVGVVNGTFNMPSIFDVASYTTNSIKVYNSPGLLIGVADISLMTVVVFSS